MSDDVVWPGFFRWYKFIPPKDTTPSYASIPDATQMNPSPKTWYIEPGTTIQDIINVANHDDKLVIMPGLHIQEIRNHDAALYIDKAIDIEIRNGAEIRAVLPGKLPVEPAIITNQSPVPVNEGDLQLIYSSLPENAKSYFLTVTSTGLNWAISSSTTPLEWKGQNIPVLPHTPIHLENGISIMPTKNLAVGANYFIVFDIHPYFVIRIGDGWQDKYISRVYIHGEGTINHNKDANGIQTAHSKTLSSGILVHGRVRDSVIRGVTMLNNQRAIQIYSEHTGSYLDYGGTTGGISYGVERITIDNVNITSSVDGILIGHPEHRGVTRDIAVRYSHISVDGVGIEPNFRLWGFTVSENAVSSKYGPAAIHLWRGPSDGTITNNIFISQSSEAKAPVIVNTLAGWPFSWNIRQLNNRFIPL